MNVIYFNGLITGTCIGMVIWSVFNKNVWSAIICTAIVILNVIHDLNEMK